MENFFTLVVSFCEARSFAIGTVESNKVGLPKELTNTKAFPKKPHGYVDRRMHASQQIATIVGKDIKLVLSLSTNMPPKSEGGNQLIVPRMSE